MKILCLMTDAFGGHGGISKFNRDLLTALCSHPDVDEVVAVPRLMPNLPGDLPAKLTYLTGGLNSKAGFVGEVLRLNSKRKHFDLIICGHINLTPLSFFCSIFSGAPLALIIHGIDAWQPTGSSIVNLVVKRVNLLISVSEYTKERFLGWAGLKDGRCVILPNSIDLARFSPGRKSQALLDRYGLDDRIVLLTLGRLDSRERAKGFDEVLEILPELAEEIPNIIYLIAGDGRDRARLEQKVKALQVEAMVVFTGFVSEEEKTDHYRLADAYVMPSRGEGFGIVLLEAMACGIPTVASVADGSREALRDGFLGTLVDPDKPEEIIAGIKKALKTGRAVPEGLDYFSEANFKSRINRVVDSLSKGGD
ncbi:MAG: glycosyltransferase family 4 protein [Geobacteraceae bacterium]|nr:glycosyltransferase family 4 protein [Geobacteraceae bacterium]